MKAVIFDMDGVIFDTERLAVQAWVQSGKVLGYAITEELVIRTIGIDIVGTEVIYKEATGQDIDFAALDEGHVAWVQAYVAENGLPVKQGIVQLLQFLKQNGYRVAIASSSYYEQIQENLKRTGLAEYFDAIVGGDMVENGKPAPDIFLKAAEQIGADPCACVVFEDSPAGITGAHAAGMRVIMVPDLVPVESAPSEKLYAHVSIASDAIAVLEHM